MLRPSLVVISFAAAVAAQDFVFPLGFGNASGPPGSSYPAARVKDQNGNGFIENEEIHAFCTVLPTTATSGTNFMTDGRYVIEDGNVVFYLTDSEDGQVLRCEDSNHNGVIDPSEATVFFRFGLRSTGAGLFAPDTLAVYRDTSTTPHHTRVYVALDNSQPSSLGYTRGIHRLADVNDNGVIDPGEQSMFVSGTMGLTVPGLSGPVAITRDFWSQVRVLPGGKVVAYQRSLPVTGVLVPNSNPAVYTYTPTPEQNCWMGFVDNNGTAVPEVWFNASTLNDLPVHPDFDDPRVPSTATFPNWDIQDSAAPATAPVRANYARFCDVVEGGGPNGADVYYLGASYRTNAEGDVNINGQRIGGLIYRVVDADGDQEIDQGEISLYCNISTQTHAGVAPITFDNQNQIAVSSLSGSTWGFSAAPSGSVSFLWENGGTNDGIVSMIDANNNGVVDQGEAFMPYATPQGTAGYLPPFHPSFGPYFTSLVGVADLAMPGPFPAGVQTIGDACISPTTGRKALMETWNGIPQIGNQALEVGCIGGLPSLPGFLMGDLTLAATPLNLGPLGLGGTCNSYLTLPIPVAFTFGDGNGTHRFNTALPNNTAYVGINLAFQMALLDPGSGTLVTYVVTNAMLWTIQP